MKIIAVMSPKGGIGKTTTSDSIAYMLGEEQGKRVLVLDGDPQGDTSKTFGVYEPDGIGMSELLEKHECVGGTYKTGDLIRPTDYSHIDIIPANGYLMKTDMNLLLKSEDNQVTRMREALEEVSDASAKQGDKATRFIVARLLNNGEPYTIPTGARAVINITKPDGKHVYNTCSYSGSDVTVELTNQALAASGTAYCDIEIRTSDDSQVITSASFTMEIEPSQRNENAILSANEFTDLENRIAGHIKNIDDTDAAVKKAESARVTAENARVKAEQARVTAENKRQENENTRIQQEQQRQQDTSQAVKNTNEARNMRTWHS